MPAAQLFVSEALLVLGQALDGGEAVLQTLGAAGLRHGHRRGEVPVFVGCLQGLVLGARGV
jgi:hypothetical protein